MGYERDEAMRQQEATEAMIRMREPRRPSEGPFMPCPAKGEAPEPVVDEFVAQELVRDQHGPSYWGSLTDEGRAMYVRRFADAFHRASLARREAAGEFD